VKISYARHVLQVIGSGTMPPGALYVSGYLDVMAKAKLVVKKANARNAARRKAPTHKKKTKVPEGHRRQRA